MSSLPDEALLFGSAATLRWRRRCPLQTGVAWMRATGDADALRHSCVHEHHLQDWGWRAHDGEAYGYEFIGDKVNNAVSRARKHASTRVHTHTAREPHAAVGLHVCLAAELHNRMDAGAATTIGNSCCCIAAGVVGDHRGHGSGAMEAQGQAHRQRDGRCSAVFLCVCRHWQRQRVG